MHCSNGHIYRYMAINYYCRCGLFNFCISLYGYYVINTKLAASMASYFRFSELYNLLSFQPIINNCFAKMAILSLSLFSYVFIRPFEERGVSCYGGWDLSVRPSVSKRFRFRIAPPTVYIRSS